MSVVRAAAIARALGVDLDRLTSSDFSLDEIKPRDGLSENAAEPWRPAETRSTDSSAAKAFARQLAPSAKTPETYRVKADHTGFGILAGDILVIDLGREAAAEDLVLATIPNPENGEHETVLRRFVPPYLIAASAMDQRPAILDDGMLPPFRPVVAVLRSKGL